VQRPHPRCPPRARKPCSGRKICSCEARGAALILGAVLAGGRSTRFGSDKAEALLDGKPLLDHAIAAIRPHVTDLVLVGRDRPGWPCLSDRPRPGLGPLGGIAAALHHAGRHGYDRVLTIACDVPHVSPELIEALIARTPAYCRDAPILAGWPASAAAMLDRYLNAPAKAGVQFDGSTRLPPPQEHEGNPKLPHLSIRRWAATLAAQPIPAPHPLANANTPADLAALAGPKPA
jgi:molybdopterin-guanine dinucleotide biosynthesis protein A